MEHFDVIVVGGGPAGLAAAIAAKKRGVERVLILERDRELGGILNQCIHSGFGLHTFGKELTGPEYAAAFIEQIAPLGIAVRLNTMVLDISGDLTVTCTSRDTGLEEFKCKAVVLAMGCRERSRGALNIPGFRCAGIYSAGAAQRLVNMEGLMPGREVVILGSGDIGLIMARRMTLEGAKVKAVAEVLPYSGGLKRNIVQCLDDYGIPLKLSHTVVDIHGAERLEGVTLAEVGPDRRPIAGTEEYIPCDTLLLSVGLLPENELTKAAGITIDGVTGGAVVSDDFSTSMPGVFACGNVLHVHDLVDFVSEEAARAGESAAEYVLSAPGRGRMIPLRGEQGVRYTVPQQLCPETMPESLVVRFRVAEPMRDRYISVYCDGVRLQHRKKRVLAPGEMESVTLRKDSIPADAKEIVVCIEEE